MPFTYSLPTFNTWAAIWWPNNDSFNPPNLVSIAQLRHPRLTMTTVLEALAGDSTPSLNMYILFPKGTDIRNPIAAAHPFNDWNKATRVVLPFDSSRRYVVNWVEDRAAGFANEHRVALAQRLPFDQVPLPPVGLAAPIIEPVIVACDGLSFAAKRYRITVSGMGGICAVGGGPCSVLDGDWIVEHTAACNWKSSALPTCHAIPTQFATLDYDAINSKWVIVFNGGVYEIPSGSFTPWASMIFPIIGSVGPCTYPVTVTVEPAP